MNNRLLLALAVLVKCIDASPLPPYQVAGCRLGEKTYIVGEELIQLCPAGGNTYAAICMANGRWDMSGKSSCQAVSNVYPVPGPVLDQGPPQTSQVYCEVLGKRRPVNYLVYKRCPHGSYAKSYCQRDGTWSDVSAECARGQKPTGGIFSQPRRPDVKKPRKSNGGIMQALLLQKAMSGGMGNLDPLTMIQLIQGKGINPLTLIGLLGPNSDNSSSPLGNLSPSLIMQLLTGQGGGLGGLGGLGALGLLNSSSGSGSPSPLGNVDPLMLYQMLSNQGSGSSPLGMLQLLQGVGGLPGLQG